MEFLRQATEVDLLLQRADPEIRPLFGKGLNPPCRHTRMVEQVALDVVLAPTGTRNRFRQDGAQHEHRTQCADREAAHRENDLPAGLLGNAVGEVRHHLLRRAAGDGDNHATAGQVGKW